MPPASHADVIAAIATPAGRGGIGVVRVSGNSLDNLIKGVINRPIAPRYATLAQFRGSYGEILDEGIALYFPSPHSYTGEDVLELHAHGGRQVLQMLLERCVALGARLAEPGEFTRRAYLNGKLDLAQAEAVSDLIEAASVDAARSAFRSQQGDFSRRCQDLIAALIKLRAWVEGNLDFPEERLDPVGDARLGLDSIRAQVDQVLASARQGRLLREGISAALIGRPNVGKSSLLNCLAGADIAIVTDQPGTTRDVIREQVIIDGVPINIVDTAGLRESREEVERLGVARAWQEASEVDVVVLVLDASAGYIAADREIAARAPKKSSIIRVLNKIDLLETEPARTLVDGVNEIRLSAKTGDGVELLRSALLDAAGWRPAGEGLFMARERHLHALVDARDHLKSASEQSAQVELCAEELRLAQNALATIGGDFVSDDLLGEIFSRFCIGK